MKKQKWIGFKKPKYIGIDFDCKGNPLIDWQEALKLKIDRDTVGYDFKVVAYKGIEDYIEKKKEEKKDLLKGTVICKAKKCNNYLYKNQSTSNPEYCMDCL